MSKKLNLTKDPIWYLLGKVTIPASVGSLFQTFYNLVDTWFAGRISPEAIGAIAKSFPIYFVIIAVGVGIDELKPFGIPLNIFSYIVVLLIQILGLILLKSDHKSI